MRCLKGRERCIVVSVWVENRKVGEKEVLYQERLLAGNKEGKTSLLLMIHQHESMVYHLGLVDLFLVFRFPHWATGFFLFQLGFVGFFFAWDDPILLIDDE